MFATLAMFQQKCSYKFGIPPCTEEVNPTLTSKSLPAFSLLSYNNDHMVKSRQATLH